MSETVDMPEYVPPWAADSDRIDMIGAGFTRLEVERFTRTTGFVPAARCEIARRTGRVHLTVLAVLAERAACKSIGCANLAMVRADQSDSMFSTNIELVSFDKGRQRIRPRRTRSTQSSTNSIRCRRHAAALTICTVDPVAEL